MRKTDKYMCMWVQDQHVYVFRTEALRAALAERPAATSLQQARTEPVKSAGVL